MTRALVSLLLGLGLFTAASAAQDDAKQGPKDDEQGYVSLTDGKTFDGWKASENEDTWSIKDGAFVAHGPRSHLFYVGDKKPFKNFELKVDVMTEPNSNGGIYIHSRYQPEGWPRYGYEIQVNNTYESDPRKTGSIYSVKDVMRKSPAKDNEWFTEHIIVKDKTITVKVDGKTVAEFTEEAGRKAGRDFTRKLDEGTFALQAHDPKSVVRYKNIRVKPLD
jgi:hypothetical protein